MNKLDQLDQYLAVDYNPDYWSDDAIDYATDLLDNFNDFEWSSLENIWQQRSIEWQVKLADAVYGSEKLRVIDLLIQMLKSSEVEVALAAAESLSAKDYIWKPDTSLLEVLEKLRERINDGNRITVEKLIAMTTMEN